MHLIEETADSNLTELGQMSPDATQDPSIDELEDVTKCLCQRSLRNNLLILRA